MGCSPSKPVEPGSKLPNAPKTKPVQPKPEQPVQSQPEKAPVETPKPSPIEEKPAEPENTSASHIPEPVNETPESKPESVQEEPKPVQETPKPEPVQEAPKLEEPKTVEPQEVPEPKPKKERKPVEEKEIETLAKHAILEEGDHPYTLLLCGAGESGKTTFTRQLKLRYLGGIQDRTSFLQTIRSNLIETVILLNDYCTSHELPIDDDALDAINSIQALGDPSILEFTPDVFDDLKTVWNDPSIQEAFNHRDEITICDHMDYFFDKIDELSDDDYVPTNDDVIRARIRSIGIETINLNLDGALITIFDVGGQKNERSKWKPYIKSETTEGFLYCVSFADFDKPMFEDPSTLRIFDSLQIFKDLTSQRPEAPFFFLANKLDAFNEKIKNTSAYGKVFPDFNGNIHDPEECYNDLVERFIKVGHEQSQVYIQPYKMIALDPEIVVSVTDQICAEIRKAIFE